jgi:hypothetical protein
LTPIVESDMTPLLTPLLTPLMTPLVTSLVEFDTTTIPALAKLEVPA